MVPSTLRNPNGIRGGLDPAEGTVLLSYPVPLPPPLQVSSGRSPPTNDFIRIAILGSASREPNLRQYGLKIAICFLKYFHKLLWSFFCCSFSLSQSWIRCHLASIPALHLTLLWFTLLLEKLHPKKTILIFSFICLNIKVRYFQALVSLDLFQDVSLGFESFLKCPVLSVGAGHKRRWGGVRLILSLYPTVFTYLINIVTTISEGPGILEKSFHQSWPG